MLTFDQYLTEETLPPEFGRNFAACAVVACDLKFKPADAKFSNLNASNVKALVGSSFRRIGRKDAVTVEFKNATERIVFVLYTYETTIRGTSLIDVYIHVMGKKKRFVGPVELMVNSYKPYFANDSSFGRKLKDAYMKA
jgi:hypothetical protein